MAGTVNKVILIGRLGADPDIRYTADGSVVAKMNVCTDEPVKQQDGSWTEKPEWHRIVVFGRQAENCWQYLTKGKAVYIEGRLRTNSWEDQQGVKRYTTEIVAREIKFIGGAPQGGQAQQPRSQGTSDNSSQAGVPDEDIPF